MMKKALLSLLAASAFAGLAGCQTNPSTATAAPNKEPEGEVITGSRIRHKGDSGSSSVQRGSGADVERSSATGR